MAVNTRIVPFPITNKEFLRAIFGARWGEVLVASFPGDPSPPPDRPNPRMNWGSVAAGGTIDRLSVDCNNYFDPSLPNPGGGRRLVDFEALCAIVIDDYGTKVNEARAGMLLGIEPSYVIETSPGNYQAGWRTNPLTDRAWVLGFLRALYLALGKTGDNLVKPMTLVRLPVGTNGKAALGPNGFRVRLVRWRAHNIIEHLDLPNIEKRIGAVTPIAARTSLNIKMPDPAEAEADPILKVFRMRGMVLDNGREMSFGWGFEVTCPWSQDHTDPRNAAAYIPIKQAFKCLHGHCEDRNMGDLRGWADLAIREDSGGLECLARQEFDEVDPALVLGPVVSGPSGQAIDLWDDKTPPGWPGGVLPAVIEDTLAELAERDGLDLGALGAATITAASGACDKRSLLTPYAGSNWSVPPILWLMLIAEPGLRKTAVLAYVLNRLRRLNADRMQRYSRDMAGWRLVPSTQRVQPAPSVRALLAEDTTIEKLQEWMAGNPRGMLYLRDELASLFDFGRYSKGPGAAERANFLEFYEGGPTTIGRMTRVTTIDNCALSIIGGIQPHRLAEFKGLADDGLLPRFGTLVMQASSVVARKATPVDLAPINSTIDRLLALGPGHYRTDTEGEEYIRWAEETAGWLLQHPHIGVGYRGFLRKLHGLNARVALVLHLIDGGPDPVVPAETVGRAQIYAGFLQDHAEVFYAGLAGSTDQIARAIGSYLLRHPATRVTAGQLRRDVAPCKPLRSLKEIQDAVFLLVIGGWLQPETNYPTNSAWRVRPGLGDQFAARRTLETARVEAVQQAMNRLGRYR